VQIISTAAEIQSYFLTKYQTLLFMDRLCVS